MDVDIINIRGTKYVVNFDTSDIYLLNEDSDFEVYKVVRHNLALENKLPKLKGKYKDKLDKLKSNNGVNT